MRYVRTILSAALSAAVGAGQLAVNPAAKAHPPTARQAASPEMQVWTAEQLGRFLAWSAEHSQFHPAWHVLAHTGMRRGELLALRWRDFDLATATVSIRQSAGLVGVKGEGGRIMEGPTKTGRPRVVDLDEATTALLKAYRRERGGLVLAYARDDAVVFGDHEGRFRHPERLSRVFAETVARCRRDLGEDVLPAIRLLTCGTLTPLTCWPLASRSRSCQSGSATRTRSRLRPGLPARCSRRSDDSGYRAGITDRFQAGITNATSL